MKVGIFELFEKEQVNTSLVNEIANAFTEDVDRDINTTKKVLVKELRDLKKICKSIKNLTLIEDRELRERVEKAKIFKRIVAELWILNKNGLMDRTFVLNNTYDLIDNYDSLNKNQLQKYLTKLKNNKRRE